MKAACSRDQLGLLKLSRLRAVARVVLILSSSVLINARRKIIQPLKEDSTSLAASSSRPFTREVFILDPPLELLLLQFQEQLGHWPQLLNPLEPDLISLGSLVLQ